MTTLPKQVTLPKKKFDQLKHIVKWYDDMPKCLEEESGDYFHELVWETQMDLLGKVAINDERYCTPSVLLKKDRLYMIVQDMETDLKEVLVELVSK